MKTFTKKFQKKRLNRMRIAYISLHWPRPAASSIGKKVNQQTAAWRAAGHEVKFFSHMHSQANPEPLVDGIHLIFKVDKGRLGGLKTELNRIAAARRLIQSVVAYQPDVIYLRWAMYVFPIQRLFRIAPVVVEVNTHDVREHRLLGSMHSLYNRLSRGIILGRACGHVYATNELMKTIEFSKYRKPGIVVTNGIDLKSTPFYPAPSNTPPHLVFIGTPGMVWHGMDKLVELAGTFPDMIVDIVGMKEIENEVNIPENLILHGFLKGAAYEAVLAGADAAIGTLSLHVKGMEEAATLKIRDCAARGIPCILPYRDTDFVGMDSRLFLQIPNTMDNIKAHGQAIHDFVFQARGQRVNREMIANRIDSRIKEKQRLEFFQKVIDNRF
jgi:hypothetical protein